MKRRFLAFHSGFWILTPEFCFSKNSSRRILSERLAAFGKLFEKRVTRR